MFLERVLYFLYPKRCIICDKKIYEKSSYACEKCLNVIKYITNNISTGVSQAYFDKLFSLFLYKGVIRKRILDFKFRNNPYLGRLFSEMMSVFLRNQDITIDVVIPVPVYYKRYLVRGYNQSTILASGISKNISKKLMVNVLLKVRKSAVQSSLGVSQRKNNVINTYGIKNAKNILNKNVLLVDDIYTTGATVNECSRILKKYGASKVFVVTIAHGGVK